MAESAPRPINRRSKAVRDFTSRWKAPDHLSEWIESLPRLQDLDGYRRVSRTHDGPAWVEPEPDPLPASAPVSHREGTCFDNESTEMREACVDLIQQYLDADAVIHEARHQYNGYHTDLVYANLDDEAVATRFALSGGTTDPIHNPLQRFRVWWHLHRNGPLAYDEATGTGGRYADEYENRKHTDWLLENGYAARTATDHVTAVLPPALGELHAVELKLRDWRKALEQADRANRSDSPEWQPAAHHRQYGYADYRWVALDAGAITPALAHRGAFRERGVGLLAIAENGTVIEHIDAAHEPRGHYTQDRAFAESRIWASLDTDDLAANYGNSSQPEPAETVSEQSSLVEAGHE